MVNEPSYFTQAPCFQGNLEEIAESVFLVRVEPCLLRQGKKTINIPNVTNIELLLSIDLLRQVDLTYHKKEKTKNTYSGSREACVPQACARGATACSSVM